MSQEITRQTNKRSFKEYIKIIGINDSSPTRFISFFSSQKNGLNNLKTLVEFGNKTRNIICKLKTIICLHHIVMIRADMHDEILNYTIEDLNQFSVSIDNGDAINWMSNLIKIYYKYILKVCAHSDVYELAHSKVYSKQQPINSIFTKIYRMMNLIKSIFSSKEFILNFGRYFKTQYPIITDINKCIADDMAVLYNSLVLMINHLKKVYKTKLRKQQIKQLLTIVDQTFILHQDLYLLFYNRYYCDDIDAPTMNWFKMQPQQYRQLKDRAQQRKKNRLSFSQLQINSLDLSNFQNTYFSQIERSVGLEYIEV